MLYTCFTPTAPGKWTVEGKDGLIAAVTVAPGQCAIVPTHQLSHIERVTVKAFMQEQCTRKQCASCVLKLC